MFAITQIKQEKSTKTPENSHLSNSKIKNDENLSFDFM